MTLRAITIATDIKGRLAGSVIAALTLASMGSAVFALPAAAANAPTESVTDSVRSGPYGLGHARQAPPTGARTANPAVAPRVLPACDSTFHPVPSPNPGAAYNAISNNGLAAISPSNVWAVGAYGDTNAGPDRTLAMKWDGTAWTQIGTPNTGPSNDDLWGVATVPGATSEIGNLWAVGDYTDINNVEHAQAHQWVTPGGWASTIPNNFGTGNNILIGVTAITATNVWAVGNWRQDNGNPNSLPPTPPSPHRTLIGHFDGTAFTTVQGPDVSMTSSDQPVSVSGSGPNDVWAVGRTTDAGVAKTLILHYNGTSWSQVTSISPSASSNTLYGVTALSSTLAYAVGDYQDVNGRRHNLIEKWNGTVWSMVASPDFIAGYDNFLFSISPVSATSIWAGGAAYAPNGSLTPSATFAQHWDGSSWKVVSGYDGNSGNFNEFNAILAVSPSEVWAAGDYFNASNVLDTLTDHLCMSVPTVTGVLPISGNTTGGTQVAISGTDFAFADSVSFGPNSASFSVNSNTQITATVPATTAAGTVDVTVKNGAGTSATSPADTYVYVPPAVSWQQYWIPRGGATGGPIDVWQPIDVTNLNVAFTPAANSSAILSGNADLWTSMVGVNQDLGISVAGGIYGNGTIVAWKESGGFAGTYSPNAAFVQTVIPVVGGTQYTAYLMWKANKATSGTIFAAAGNSPYSPTRLTAELVPASSANLQSVATNTQYWLAGSNGTSWQDMDGTGALTITNFTPAVTGSALVSANADLWTATGGVNQDFGINVSGGTFGTTGGTIVGWKESGGFAGTYSPNAAYAQSVIQLVGGTPYTIKVQWKANKNTAGTIFTAAGGAGNYSPTRLTLRIFPAGTGLQDAAANQQYFKAGSTGADWTPIDTTNLKLTVTPAANSLYVLSANADLWTATAGVNQDMGIFISGGAYGSGVLVAWKESGGFAGTFSPNAAFVQTVMPLAMGVTYTITLEWKANKATGGVIYAAAGGAGNYSPTRLTAQLLS